MSTYSTRDFGDIQGHSDLQAAIDYCLSRARSYVPYQMEMEDGTHEPNSGSLVIRSPLVNGMWLRATFKMADQDCVSEEAVDAAVKAGRYWWTVSDAARTFHEELDTPKMKTLMEAAA